MLDENLSKMLNDIFGWSQHIRREAQIRKNDGIDDDALIIQEIIEDYLYRQCNINPNDVIEYKKYGINGRTKFDR